ncbi:MAG: site-specific integrase, partial [Ruthenibacterium sp.]
TVINGVFQTYIDSPVWHGDYNPARMTSMPRGLSRSRRNPPSAEQLKIVKESANDPDALPSIVYLCTGERRGEGCGIQLKDIDFESGVIHVTKAVEWISNQPHITTTKTESGLRQIPLLSLLRTALAPYRDLDGEIYIIGLSKKSVTASWYQRNWASFWRKHGFAHPVTRTMKRTRAGREYEYKQTDWIADVCAHQFRHEYVCMLVEAGVSEEVAIQLVGHANAQMIHEVYFHLKPNMIQEAGAMLNQHMCKNAAVKPAEDV